MNFVHTQRNSCLLQNYQRFLCHYYVSGTGKQKHVYYFQLTALANIVNKSRLTVNKKGLKYMFVYVYVYN